MRTDSVYLASLNAGNQNKNNQVAAPAGEAKKGSKKKEKRNQSAAKMEPVMSQVDQNLHEDPDLPITGPGEIFEWAAYFLQDEYDKIRKNSKFQNEKRISTLKIVNEKIKDTPIPKYKSPALITFADMKRPDSPMKLPPKLEKPKLIKSPPKLRQKSESPKSSYT